MVDRLNIRTEMAAFDHKHRDFWNDLTDEERRKFSPFLMIRWGSSVESNRELQEYYVIATNQLLNRHFFAISTARHKKLQWLMATTVSPDMGTQRHVWIAPYKRNKNQSVKRRALANLYPDLDDRDLDVLAEIVSQQEIDAQARLMGEE